MSARQQVFSAINDERTYQDRKWGPIEINPHEVGSWLTITRKLLSDAEAAYVGHRGNQGALDELRKVAAVSIACMEQHGIVPRKSVDVTTQSTAFTVAKSNLDIDATTATPGRPALREGEYYAGVILGKDGQRDYHLVLLPGEAESANWADAKEWATKAGGTLPNRREQALLYANLKEQFKDAWYWSSEQHASVSASAWGQDFDYGDQRYYYVYGSYRARAVRRLEIQ